MLGHEYSLDRSDWDASDLRRARVWGDSASARHSARRDGARRLARRRLLLGRRNERPRHALCRRSSYDRSLIHLASRHGVDVALGNFAHARIERERLELELASRGLDLRFRRRASGSPGTTRSTGNAQASA